MRIEWQKKITVLYNSVSYITVSYSLVGSRGKKRKQNPEETNDVFPLMKMPIIAFTWSYLQILLQIFFNEILSSDKWWSWTFQTTVLIEIIWLQNVTWE